MKTTDKKTLFIAASTLIVGLLAGWLVFDSPTAHLENGPVSIADAETVYTCSMHPQVRQNEEGDCPICGMDLIPVEDGQNSETDPMAISMSPTAMQLASVSTAFVEKTNPVKKLRLNGKIQADERLVYSQTSHIPGRIEKLMVSFTGEYVRKGQTIALIYSPELVMAQEELFEAKKIAASQPRLLAVAKEKLKNWKLSDDQVDEILKSGKTVENFPVKADISGFVTKKMVSQGDYVRQGETFYQITDLSKVWVLFDVYESDIVWIKKDDRVEFSIASLPGESFEGTVSYIDPVIDPVTRVTKARVQYNNANGELKPGMFVSGLVEAKMPGKSDVLVVPKSAVMWTGKRSVVYVKNMNDKMVNFTMREIILGAALGDSFIVESGLNDGEEIAVQGTFSIDAAAQLAGKPSMMSPSGGSGQVMTGHNHGSMETGGSAEKNKQSDLPAQDVANVLLPGQKAKDALKPLYEKYFGWKDALVGDDFSEARELAQGMKEEMDKTDMTLFNGDAHRAWMEYREALGKGLQHVNHVSDIEQLRKAFQSVSLTMVEMTNVFRPLETPIYVQHCPMADSNKGADWLSREKEIKNPYFGSSMLTCGEITGEIN